MKVYVAEREWNHEGFTIIGVFLTREAAEEACKKDVDLRGRSIGDGYEVEEYELIS